MNVYGESKLAGEKAIQEKHNQYLIFRTAWVYASRGNNFLMTMLRLITSRDSLGVVDDQRGTPTWARTLAQATTQALKSCYSQGGNKEFESEILHLVANNHTTWFGFASAIKDILGVRGQDCHLEQLTTEQFPTQARRPSNSCLNNQRFCSRFDLNLPDWRVALDNCMADM